MRDSPIAHSTIVMRKTPSGTRSCAVTRPSRLGSRVAMTEASGARRISGLCSA